MNNPLLALKNETSALKRFRLILIAVLSVAVVTSAALSIFMIVTGYSDETLWKVTGTFGLFAGFSLVMLIQTASLYRLKIWDKLVTTFGVIASSLLVSLALDLIYTWRFYENIFRGQEDFSAKFFLTAGVTAGFTAVTGLLRSSMKINPKIKIATVVLTITYAVRLLTDIWFPNLFSTLVEDKWYDENNQEQIATFYQPAGWWIDSFTILSILLAMSLVLSLVSHILGNNKSKASPVIDAKGDTKLIPLMVSRETLIALEAKAKAEKLTVEEYLKTKIN